VRIESQITQILKDEHRLILHFVHDVSRKGKRSLLVLSSAVLSSIVLSWVVGNNGRGEGLIAALTMNFPSRELALFNKSLVATFEP
jgi:hypothetical protein